MGPGLWAPGQWGRAWGLGQWGRAWGPGPGPMGPGPAGAGPNGPGPMGPGPMGPGPGPGPIWPGAHFLRNTAKSYFYHPFDVKLGANSSFGFKTVFYLGPGT